MAWRPRAVSRSSQQILRILGVTIAQDPQTSTRTTCKPWLYHRDNITIIYICHAHLARKVTTKNANPPRSRRSDPVPVQTDPSHPRPLRWHYPGPLSNQRKLWRFLLYAR